MTSGNCWSVSGAASRGHLSRLLTGSVVLTNTCTCVILVYLAKAQPSGSVQFNQLQLNENTVILNHGTQNHPHDTNDKGLLCLEMDPGAFKANVMRCRNKIFDLKPLLQAAEDIKM